MIAAGNGYLEVTRELLKAGADVNASDNDGQTPLMEAVSKWGGHPDTIRVLINAGATVNAENQYGQTPLWPWPQGKDTTGSSVFLKNTVPKKDPGNRRWLTESVEDSP